MPKLERTHVHAIDRLTGERVLQSVNPTCDFGWNDGGWDGVNSEKKRGETIRVVAQRKQGSEEVNFFTPDGKHFPTKDVPKWVKDALKKHPLVSKGRSKEDTLVRCKHCAGEDVMIPASVFTAHLERHLADLTPAEKGGKRAAA